MKLFRRLLKDRPIRVVHDADRDAFSCLVTLYGKMPATPPCTVQSAKTEPIAILAAVIDVLIVIETDYDA
jgi:hypothetical protein